jgi:hypothetical protein
MPLFDVDGREKNVGNMSCPTCHNAHEWAPPLKERAVEKGVKGKTVKSFRFLRNMSYNTFCIDCHGPAAIYRYMYFHDPEKRLKK